MGLPVSTRDNLCAGAFGVGKSEEVLHLGNSCCRGAVGEEVIEQVGLVVAADSLDPDIGCAIGRLKDVRRVGS